MILFLRKDNKMNKNDLIFPQELKSRQYLTIIENTEILNEPDNIRACELLKEVSNFTKTIKQQEKDETEYFKSELKKIKLKYAKPLEFLKNADSILRNKINAYAMEKLAQEQKNAHLQKIAKEDLAIKQIEMLEQLKKDAERYDPVTRQAFLSILEDKQKDIYGSIKDEKINISNNSVTFRKIWTFEVIDISKVPTSYITINSKAVNDAIKCGNHDIPGLLIYKTTKAAIK